MRLMIGVLAAAGTYFLYTAVVFGWRDIRISPTLTGEAIRRDRFREWMNQAGLSDVATAEFVGVVTGVTLAAGVVGFLLFGGVAPGLAIALFGALIPIGSYRLRREHRIDEAREAWPQMIEEIRLRTASLGRSIPQALFEVGRRAPDSMQPAFADAHREWLLTTDFERTTAVLKDRLADPAADVVCETLLVAHELGGAELGQRLTALAEDRILDLQGRKDAVAKQAGVRLARRFVLVVPFGMALAGMQIGAGRSAFASPFGQAVALVAIGMVAICWLWAGRIMKLPEPQRVLP